jgi:hypothetical protein
MNKYAAAFTFPLLFLIGPPVAAQTANPFGAVQPAVVQIPIQRVQQTALVAPLPPIIFYARIGDVALLQVSDRRVRATNRQKLTLAGQPYTVRLNNDQIAFINAEGEPVFYAAIGYGIAAKNENKNDD